MLYRYIAEASPFDPYWGIQMDIDDPCAQYPAYWRGQNFMGQILMDVREELRDMRV